jgi:hypothetical protein
MIDNKNLLKKDITGVDTYQGWYKPFDDEKRLAFMIDEDLTIEGRKVNVIDWKNGLAILCADVKDRDWAQKVKERVKNGYEVELYIKNNLCSERYVQVDVKKCELSDEGHFIITF